MVGNFAMGVAIEKAKSTGVGWVTVRGSNHFGIAGHYSAQALRQNMLGMAFTNGRPLNIPLPQHLNIQLIDSPLLIFITLRKSLRGPHQERHLLVLHTAAVLGLSRRGWGPPSAGHGYQRGSRGQNGAGQDPREADPPGLGSRQRGQVNFTLQLRDRESPFLTNNEAADQHLSPRRLCPVEEGAGCPWVGRRRPVDTRGTAWLSWWKFSVGFCQARPGVLTSGPVSGSTQHSQSS